MEIVAIFLRSKSEPTIDDFVSDGTNIYLVEDIQNNVLYGVNTMTGERWSGTGTLIVQHLTILYTQNVKVYEAPKVQ